MKNITWYEHPSRGVVCLLEDHVFRMQHEPALKFMGLKSLVDSSDIMLELPESFNGYGTDRKRLYQKIGSRMPSHSIDMFDDNVKNALINAATLDPEQAVLFELEKALSDLDPAKHQLLKECVVVICHRTDEIGYYLKHGITAVTAKRFYPIPKIKL